MAYNPLVSIMVDSNDKKYNSHYNNHQSIDRTSNQNLLIYTDNESIL